MRKYLRDMIWFLEFSGRGKRKRRRVSEAEDYIREAHATLKKEG